MACQFDFRNMRRGARHGGRMGDEHAQFFDPLPFDDVYGSISVVVSLYTSGWCFGRHGQPAKTPPVREPLVNIRSWPARGTWFTPAFES